MATASSLRLCLAFVIGLLLFAIQVTSKPLDALPKETGSPTSHLVKRGTLTDLYDKITSDNKVLTGAVKAFEEFPGKGKDYNVYGPSPLTGCTVIMIVGGKGIVIGHFVQNKKDDNCLLDGPASDDIIKKMQTQEALVDVDFEEGTHAFFLYANNINTNADGVKKIRSHLKDDLGITDIKEFRYSPASGTGDSGWKVAIEWKPADDKKTATVNVYVNQDTSSLTATYGSDGEPSSGGSSGPAAPAPTCTYMGPQPPVINEAYCSCNSKSYPLTTITGDPVPESSSCAYKTLPGAPASIPNGFPPFTDSAACQVCTPYAANGADCTTIPNCTPVSIQTVTVIPIPANPPR